MKHLDLLTQYGLFDAKVPRYTSYPPANHFTNGTGTQHQIPWLAAVPDGSDVSIYIHIPFCKRLCWFCACRTQGTQTLGPVKTYIETMKRELRHVRSVLPKSIRMGRLHLGGGTPTILPADVMDDLLTTVFDAYVPADRFEFSVEVDPTDASDAVLQTLVDFGLNRASIGVQDFDPMVQQAIGRPQSVAQTERVVDWLRSHGVPSLNFDLLYGLPHQTNATFAKTIEHVLALGPDRLAIYGYAHVPWMSKRQVMIRDDTLPNPQVRYDLAEQAKAAFEHAGYTAIGIDHFAAPTDSLATSASTGTLRRNFQGYTDDTSRTLIGFGASAISRFSGGYVQNAVSTSAYQDRVAAGGAAGAKGFGLSPSDILIADMIEELMCYFVLNLGRLRRTHPDLHGVINACANGLIDRYSDLLTRSNGVIAVRDFARPIVRIIAHDIDQFTVETTAMAHSAAM